MELGFIEGGLKFMLYKKNRFNCTDKKIKSRTQKGLTLIEIVISIGILGIISVAFLSMFSTSLSEIFKSGRASTSHYEAQYKMENSISEKPISGTPSTTVQLKFGDKSYQVTGRTVDIDYSSGNQTKKLTSFTVD